MNARISILICIALLASAGALAQAQGGTITADPDAKPLRPIWVLQGYDEQDGVGSGSTGLGDIFGTGRGAWAVYYGTYGQWWVFRYDSGAIAADTIPVWTFDSTGSQHVAVGDFWGTGHKAIGFERGSLDTFNNSTRFYYELHLFRTDSNRIADTPAAILNTRKMNPRRQLGVAEALLAADLDGDHVDEFIAVLGGVGLDTGISYYPELWIYKGGQNFQVDSPTVIVRHPIRNAEEHVRAATGDFDGDGRPDIAILRAGNPVVDDRNHLTFYWGTGDLATFGKPENTRVIELKTEYPDAGLGITALDCDGDGVMDLATDAAYRQPTGTYLFRSGSGKNARTRSYQTDDADIVFPGRSVHILAGHLNDNTRKYDMLLLGGSPIAVFGGGVDGPDLAYDAHSTLPVFGVSHPLLDVDGDGWDDFLTSNFSVNHNRGVAVIFAGGPYIPSPKTSSVEAITGEGHEQAITVWPNPVHDELHIAWRGDLRRMPSRFVVHDPLGREITSGEVESWRGSALWRCSAVPAGIFLLSILDPNGVMIATTTVVTKAR